jgi:hypothetical protein
MKWLLLLACLGCVGCRPPVQTYGSVYRDYLKATGHPVLTDAEVEAAERNP